MQSDTRKILIVGSAILFIGILSTILMLTIFGGVGEHGPHNDPGWLALVVTLCCLPLGLFGVLLGLAKLIGDRRRS